MKLLGWGVGRWIISVEGKCLCVCIYGWMDGWQEGKERKGSKCVCRREGVCVCGSKYDKWRKEGKEGSNKEMRYRKKVEESYTKQEKNMEKKKKIYIYIFIHILIFFSINSFSRLSICIIFLLFPCSNGSSTFIQLIHTYSHLFTLITHSYYLTFSQLM